MGDVAKLKAACDAVMADPKLQPIKDQYGDIVTTFCNMGAMRIAFAMGCEELQGLTADQQHSAMTANQSGKWTRLDRVSVTAHALHGGLAFAAMSSKQLGEAHGHIAAIYPATMQMSGSLGHEVPVVANVGVQDVAEKESMAFPVAKGEPDYFAYEYDS